MDVKRIKNMGRELNTFLAEFDDCFARSESRERLRNVLNPDEIKYFVSNMTAGPGVSLEWMLWVAFSRWPVERCFELAKRNLGMDHFEIRSWRGIHRHLYISQLSLLFRSCVHKRLGTEKNVGGFVSDRRAGSSRRRRGR